MDLPENSNISGCCRICLAPEPKFPTIESDKYLQLYEYCIGFRLTKAGNVSIEFCGQCMETLKKFSQFRKKCMDSENWWKITQLKDLQVKVEKLNNFEHETFEDSYNNENSQIQESEVEYTPMLNKENNNDKALNKKQDKPVKLHTKLKKRQLRKRTKALKLMCDYCGKLFRKQGFLKRHMTVCLTGDKIKKQKKIRDKEPSEFDCGICCYKSSETEDVERHFRQHLTNNNLECKLCSFVGIDEAHMIFHRYEHCSNKTYKMKCPECDFISISRLKLQFHYRSVHLMKPGGFCSSCEITKTTYKQFKIHLLFHKRGGFTCDICGFTFAQRCDIVEHLTRVHSNVRKYVCETCGERYKSSTGLKVHIESKHEPKKSIKCNHCDKVFKNEGSLKKHLKEKTFFCATCGKGFGYIFLLKEHALSHSEERNFACDYCSLKFKSKGALSAHLRCHTGYKPFKCEHCDKSFIQGVALRRHYSVHTGVRRNKCSLCEKSFHTRKLLSQHCFKKHDIADDHVIAQQ